MSELIAQAGTAGTGSIWGMLLPILGMFAFFYFFLLRPQQKKQKTRNAMLGALKKGDKIVTIGGLHGTILEITDDTCVIRVNDVTKMTFDRNAISHVVSSGSTTEEPAKA